MIDGMTVEEWNKRGIELTSRGKYEKAMDAYNKALEADPQFDGAWYNKGIALSKLGKYEKALYAYIKATEINPQDADGWYNQGKCP